MQGRACTCQNDWLSRRSANPARRDLNRARRFVHLVFDHSTGECSSTPWVPQFL